MAKRKKMEFRPDPAGTGLLSKLYVTPSQRKKLLKWTLYGLLCVAVLVVQDVILSRLSLFGGTVDLTPSVIMLVCILEGAQSGSVFALAASIVYLYSGSAPGTYCILFVTVPAILAAIFRQNYLRRGFSANWLCTAVATLMYQMGVYFLALFFGNTYPERVTAFLMNAVLAAVVLPVVYPVFGAVGKIGGETWKE